MISGAAHQGAITTSGKLSENSRRGSEPIIDLFTWADDPLSSRLHRGNGNASGQVASGRGFISEDPIGFAGGDVNLFAYARNNPVKWVDPLGLAPAIPPYYPPGWTPDWQWAPGSKLARPDWNWWDPNGGEWHWDPDPNGSHPEFPNGHYDYHPWDQWNSPKDRCPPGDKVPKPPVPWWQGMPSRWPGPFPIIILPPGGDCIFNPAGCANPT